MQCPKAPFVNLYAMPQDSICSQYSKALIRLVQVVVTNDELCAAIENTFEETRSMLEPAG
jgi:hypothetical protein